MSIIIKGSSWKWANHSISKEPEDIELISPTSEEIGRAGISDSFLIRINSMDSLLIPLQMKHEIVAILKEEKPAELPDDITFEDICNTAKGTVKMVNAINMLSNYLKTKEK